MFETLHHKMNLCLSLSLADLFGSELSDATVINILFGRGVR
jgi:hypothetical protein